jgi:hypothetical protein
MELHAAMQWEAPADAVGDRLVNWSCTAPVDELSIIIRTTIGRSTTATRRRVPTQDRPSSR